MKGRSLLFAVVIAGLGALTLRFGVRAREVAAVPSKESASASAALPAQAYAVESAVVLQTLNAVGTLVANEAVTIVGESSRRVAEVHVSDGARVGKGDLLFKLDDADLRADLQRLEGRRGLAISTETRLRELIGQLLVSQQDYDRAVSELRAIDGEIGVLKVALLKTEIRAPFAGRLGLRRVSEGAYINPNTPLTTLQDVTQLKLDFALPERYADVVKLGEDFRFRIEGRGEVFTARVTAVEPQIDPGTRSLLVRGIAPNPNGALSPGASASVEIDVKKSDGIMIPSRALLPSIKGNSVFVAENGKAVEHEVRIGMRTAERVEVLSGLKPGDVVITSNLLRLRPGVAVKLLPHAD